MGAAGSSPIAKVQGFQIGRVLANSPAHEAGLCPFFDIITGVDDIALDLDSVDFFKDYVAKNIGTAIRLTLFNLRVRGFRVVSIVPSATWGGIGLLGCAMEWSGAEAALELTWHIESIDPAGPAAQCADLQAGRDYIIGMQAPDDPIVTLFTNATFAEKMEGWRALRRTNAQMSQEERETLLLLVFDSESNEVKEVPVHMGTHTSLGVGIADGYLHFVPELPISDPAQVANSLPFISRFSTGEAVPTKGPSVPAAAATTPQLVSPPPAATQEQAQTTIPAPPAPPSFPSFLPTQASGAPGPLPHPYPGALPFPSVPFPPTVRPQIA